MWAALVGAHLGRGNPCILRSQLEGDRCFTSWSLSTAVTYAGFGNIGGAHPYVGAGGSWFHEAGDHFSLDLRAGADIKQLLPFPVRAGLRHQRFVESSRLSHLTTFSLGVPFLMR